MFDFVFIIYYYGGMSRIRYYYRIFRQIGVYGNSGFVDLKNKFAGLINFISHSFGLINNE